MTLRTRRRIFYTLVVLFFIVGGGVVFYAYGWRIDFTTWHFEKIGGIYVRSFPENASIYLNGVPVANQSGFLSPGTLISELLPKTYSVILKAPGYDDWQENAVVTPSLVTQFKYAVLVPQTATPVSSTVAEQLLLANTNSAATTTDPFDANQKIVVGKNMISIYDVNAATTTQSVKVAGKNISVKWIAGSLIGILQSNGEFYLYDTNAQTLAKQADDVKSFAATANGSMVATLEQNSLEIFSLDGSGAYYRFNVPNVAEAQSVIWYHDDEHLFVVYPENVSFLDLADAELTNFVQVAQGTKPFYDGQDNIFYITNEEGKLVNFAFPN
jgi:hypothetical protein